MPVQKVRHEYMILLAVDMGQSLSLLLARSSERNERQELDGILQHERASPVRAFRISHLEPGLQSFDVQVYPAPKNSIEDDNNGGKIAIEEEVRV